MKIRQPLVVTERAICGSLLVASTSAVAVGPSYWGADLEYRGVGGIHHLGDPNFSASGVAIGPRHAITARHNGGTRFTVAGVMYTWVRRYNHPVYDIAVVEFDRDLPFWYRVPTSSTVGATVTMVGYGGSAWLNAAGNGYDVDPTRTSTRRKANSTLDFKWRDPNYNVPHLMSYLVEDGCAVAVGGDSGGGFFVNGELVGVISAFFSTNQNRPFYGFGSQNGGVPYFGTAAVDLTAPEVTEWLRQFLCPADFNGDNQLDFFDYLDFVQAFSTEDPSADYNDDGQVDFFDYLDFVDAFSAGC